MPVGAVGAVGVGAICGEGAVGAVGKKSAEKSLEISFRIFEGVDIPYGSLDNEEMVGRVVVQYFQKNYKRLVKNAIESRKQSHLPSASKQYSAQQCSSQNKK